ncbi:DUF3592 domain-containing protein [Microbispora catharanthi]|uniref:DUF3592 domain-containing protein n=1 Tax=Microbispora catharanthi TaxID=1712871 RepID=UPI001378B872|nr:DUF3592 domain-containing protein [Microbispora catharanthi]
MFGIFALAFGVAFIAGGIHRFRSGRAFLASAHRVPGIVVGSHRVWRTDSHEYFPILRFRTLDGAEIETVGQTRGGSFEIFNLTGRQVVVLYDPDDPRKARMDTSSGRGLTGSVGLVIAGCVFLAIGLVMLAAAVT